MILEKNSSVLGYPGEISKPINADHLGVCNLIAPKTLFTSACGMLFGYSFKILRWRVSKYSFNLHPRWQLRASVDEVQENKIHNLPFDFEEYLSAPESPERDYYFFRDRLTPVTCNWVLKNAAFNDWLQDTGCNSRVLWVNGNAASGKSILSSFVIYHVVQLGQPCQYFFIRFESNKKRILSHILRSLACQLARSIPEYAEKLQQLEAAGNLLTSKQLAIRAYGCGYIKRVCFSPILNIPCFGLLMVLTKRKALNLLYGYSRSFIYQQ